MKIIGAVYTEYGDVDLVVTINGVAEPYTYSSQSEDDFAIKIGNALIGVDISPYIPPPPLTSEELRNLMPDKTPREFRDILIDEGILTDALPDEVTLAIQEIPYDKERMKALNAWHNPTMFSRSDPYVDMIGAMFGLIPEDIDRLWNEN